MPMRNSAVRPTCSLTTKRTAANHPFSRIGDGKHYMYALEPRRFRFSLRTLLLTFFVIGLALGLFYYVFLRELQRPLQSTEFQLLVTLPGQSDVTVLEFSPEGETLVSGHADGSLKWWDYRHASLLRTVPLAAGDQPRGGVDSIAFSPDGHLIAATARGERTLNIWDAQTGRIVKSIVCSDIPTSVRFSPEGNLIAACVGPSSVCLWDCRDFAVHANLPINMTYGPKLYFSPDGKGMVILQSAVAGSRRTSPNRLVVVDVLTNQQKWSADGSYFDHVAFSPDGTTLLTLWSDSSIALWNASDGTSSGSLPHELCYSGVLSNVHWLNTSNEIIGGFQLMSESRWTNLQSSLRGASVVVASGEVFAWEAATGAVRTVIQDPLPIVALAVSSDENMYATGSYDGTIRVWKCEHTPAKASR